MTRALAVLIVVLAGYGTAVPSPNPSGAVALTPTPAASASTTAPPTPADSPTPAASAASGVTDLAVDIHSVESDLTRHIETFVSLGSEIVWSGGATEADNNLYRLPLGADEPQLLYENPDPRAVLTVLSGSSSGYVFVAQHPNGSWRLMFLGPGVGEPVELDASTDDKLPTPTIAMDDSWIAWEAVHGTLDDHLNELRAARVDDPLHPLTLLSFAGRDAYVAFPSLLGDELWYGIADNDWVANTERPRIEMIDLRDPQGAPAVFGAEQRAFMPAPGADVVAWKSGGTDDLAALNAGTLTLFHRSTATAQLLPIPGDERLAERISYPSVGSRFVAWWDDARYRLYVYDLAERQFRRVLEFDPSGDDLIARPSLSGDLLAWLHYLPSGDRRLEWATLPQ